jgi:hypothetical protein
MPKTESTECNVLVCGRKQRVGVCQAAQVEEADGADLSPNPGDNGTSGDSGTPTPGSHYEGVAEAAENAFTAETGLPIRATLVVAPKSVLPNWKREIENGVLLSPPLVVAPKSVLPK